MVRLDPLDCCVPVFAPIVIQYPGKPPQPSLRSGEWSPLMQWQGFTSRTLTFQVRVSSADKDAAIGWRRWGGAIIPFSFGVFQRQSLFHVYPGDIFFRVDIKSFQADVEVTIERLD